MDEKRHLSAIFVKSVRHSGKPYGQDKYYDQHGLILRVIPTGGKQWKWRGTIHGKRLDLGLGGWPYVSLSEHVRRHSTTGSWREQAAIPVRCVPGEMFRRSQTLRRR